MKNKGNLIDYIDNKIISLSGGESMKSVTECLRDNMIIKELQEIKQFITENY